MRFNLPALLFLCALPVFSACSSISPAKDDSPDYASETVEGITWYLAGLGQETMSQPVERRPHLLLDAEASSFSGFSGCNRFTGRYELDGANLSLGNAAVTRMACADSMALEDRFLAMLGRVNSWKRDGELLVFLDESQAVLASFTHVR